MCVISIFDVKTRKIPFFMLFGLLMAAVVSFVIDESTVFDIMLGLIPGGIVAFISFASNERVGMGDAFILMILGMGLGLEPVAIISCIALVLNCSFSAILLFLKKANRNTEIPFAPFITAGMGVYFFAFF